MVDPYAWHAAAMAGLKPPVHSDPECGWFLRYTGTDGKEMNYERHYLPASVYWERQIDPETGEILGDDILRCDIGGVFVDPEAAWISIAKRPISEDEYMTRLSALFRDPVEAL